MSSSESWGGSSSVRRGYRSFGRQLPEPGRIYDRPLGHDQGLHAGAELLLAAAEISAADLDPVGIRANQKDLLVSAFVTTARMCPGIANFRLRSCHLADISGSISF